MDLGTLARIHASQTACTLNRPPRAFVSTPFPKVPSTNGVQHVANAGAMFLANTACTSCSMQSMHGRRRRSKSCDGPRNMTVRALSKDDPMRKLSAIESDAHRRFLAKYVNEVDPAVVDTFPKSAPSYVADAMRLTVDRLTGSLPSQFFDISISTVGDNLKSLMFSFLMTGYLFRNVEHHLELKHTLERALPSSVLFDDGPAPRKAGAQFGLRSEERDGYALGANVSGISGTVTRWRYATGAESVPAADYVDMLEKEVQHLREQLKEKDSKDVDGGNALMEYLRTTPYNIHDLRVSTEVNEAMQTFLKRLLGTTEARELADMPIESSATEMSHLLMWLLIVGYTLRNMEVRFSMEQSYSLPVVSLEDKGLTGDC